MRPLSAQCRHGGATLVAVAVWTTAALGQPAPLADRQGPGTEAAERADVRVAEKARTEQDLQAIERQLAEAESSRTQLAAEAESLKADGAKLSAALVDAAARARATEERLGPIEARLGTLADSEAAITASLDARRERLADVLAALQRMGRSTGPAMLARQEDVLAAIRTAMMLGSVVPGLREEAETLAGDLAELRRLRQLAAADRGSLNQELYGLARDRLRLSALMKARQDRAASTDADLSAARARSDVLGSQARSLRDLVDRLEGEIGAARNEAQDARRVAETAAKQARERFAAASARDPARLAPKITFPETRGLLARPAAGSTIRDFGAPDGFGGAMHGIVIASRPRAVVTAPADGSVVFAGSFRSFGRLVILDVGGGYYLLTAGMGQISVAPGQFVLAGEPVGQMGETASPSAAMGAVEANGPVLYVEFRKDGVSVDPSPWWSRSQSEKVRG